MSQSLRQCCSYRFDRRLKYITVPILTSFSFKDLIYSISFVKHCSVYSFLARTAAYNKGLDNMAELMTDVELNDDVMQNLRAKFNLNKE